MFGGMAIVEKVYKNSLEPLTPEERVAVIAILSRALTVFLLLILPSVNVVFEVIRTHVLPRYFMDYFLGTLFGINASTLVMHTLASGQRFPAPQVITYMVLYYNIITNGSWFVYYFVLFLSVFSALRVLDDISIIFPFRRILLLANGLRYTEELSIFGFLLWSFFTWENRDITKLVVFPTVVVVAYMYSDRLEDDDTFSAVSRRSTTLPSIKKTLTAPTFRFGFVEDVKQKAENID